MCNYRVAVIFAVSLGYLAASAFAAVSRPETITPIFSLRHNVTEQPFGGEMRFLHTPVLGQVCSLKVDLTSHKSIAESVIFRLVKPEVYSMAFAPDTIKWDAPIDSGASRTFYFSFTPTLAGSHRIALTRQLGKSWPQLGMLQFNVDEDGKIICAGPPDSCLNTLVPPHPVHTNVPLVIEFPINELEPRRDQDRHFSSIFTFTPPKAMKDTAFIDFELECHVGLYMQVQFQVETSTNISISKLPESWGDNAGPSPGYRHFRGRVSMVPLRAGPALFDFKVIGKHPSARGDGRIVTEYPVHLVIGESGEILFVGHFDPYTRFKVENDPMLGTLKQLLSIGNRDYRTRIAISLPDFRGEEIDARDGTDTAEADTSSRKK